MVHVENKHWYEIEHQPDATRWLSRIVVGSHTANSFDELQQRAIASFIAEDAPADIREAEVSVDDFTDLLEVTFSLEASDRELALAKTAVISIDAFIAANLDFDDLRFTSGRLIEEERLHEDLACDPEASLKEVQYSADEDLNALFAQIRNARDL